MSAFVWDYFKTFSAILNGRKEKKKKRQASVLLPFIYPIQVKAHTQCRYIAYMYALDSLIQPDFKELFKKKWLIPYTGKASH